jgi:hypothetical protein
MLGPFLIMDAIHSTAMEHTHGPGSCDVCAASAGDRAALMRIFTAVYDARAANDALSDDRVLAQKERP